MILAAIPQQESKIHHLFHNLLSAPNHPQLSLQNKVNGDSQGRQIEKADSIIWNCYQHSGNDKFLKGSFKCLFIKQMQKIILWLPEGKMVFCAKLLQSNSMQLYGLQPARLLSMGFCRGINWETGIDIRTQLHIK